MHLKWFGIMGAFRSQNFANTFGVLSDRNTSHRLIYIKVTAAKHGTQP